MAKRSTKWHKKLEKSVFSSPEGLAAYEAFRLQYELAKQLAKLRKNAHLTQDQIAKCMATHKPVISRLESVSASTKHLPSLLTLIKYADAVGYKLKISFIPRKKILKPSSINR